MPMRFQHAPHVKDAPILEAHGLTVRFGLHLALDRLTFALQPGDQVAVVGPNGAGKSTLFKAIAGLLEPTDGSLTVFGHRPTGHSCIAYVPQRSQVDWNFPATVREVVQMGRVGKLGFFRRPAPADHAKIDDCLREVGLLELADRQLSDLSGGQQQRMFIARALAMEAELMLLDEPFSALDLVTQQEVLALVLGLRAQGVTVLVALHDLNLAATRFNRVLLLRNRAIGFGHPDEVLIGPNLQAAYGDTARVIPTGEGRIFVGDTCCGGGHDHA